MGRRDCEHETVGGHGQAQSQGPGLKTTGEGGDNRQRVTEEAKRRIVDGYSESADERRGKEGEGFVCDARCARGQRCSNAVDDQSEIASEKTEAWEGFGGLGCM